MSKSSKVNYIKKSQLKTMMYLVVIGRIINEVKLNDKYI